MKQTNRVLIAVAAGSASGLALAAGEATAAITAAQTEALAVAGGLLAMGIAIWGAMFIKRKFFP